MDQATLVSPDLAAGREALAVLDKAGIKNITALFASFPEYSDWRFVLSSASLDQHSSLKAAERVYEILSGKFVYSLPLLMVLPARDPIIRALKRSFVGKVKAGEVIRMGGQMVGNRFASELIIVRLPGVIG
jgi:hypothetical protein